MKNYLEEFTQYLEIFEYVQKLCEEDHKDASGV